MKIFIVAILITCGLLSGCETLKNMTKPQHRCHKCGLELFMITGDVRAKTSCPNGGRHEWRRILNR